MFRPGDEDIELELPPVAGRPKAQGTSDVAKARSARENVAEANGRFTRATVTGSSRKRRRGDSDCLQSVAAQQFRWSVNPLTGSWFDHNREVLVRSEPLIALLDRTLWAALRRRDNVARKTVEPKADRSIAQTAGCRLSFDGTRAAEGAPGRRRPRARRQRGAVARRARRTPSDRRPRRQRPPAVKGAARRGRGPGPMREHRAARCSLHFSSSPPFLRSRSV